MFNERGEIKQVSDRGGRILEIGAHPNHARVELLGKDVLAPSRCHIHKSPFCNSGGSAELSKDNFLRASSTWDAMVRAHPDELSVVKAWGRDAEGITKISRIWRDRQDLVRLSGLDRAIELYFKKSGIYTERYSDELTWEVLARSDVSAHPLNKIVNILNQLGVGVYCSDRVKSGGAFTPQGNVIVLSIEAMLNENCEVLVETLYHETVHAAFFNTASSEEESLPFRSVQTNRNGGNNSDPYGRVLFFNEMQAYPAGAIFRSHTDQRSQDSIKLMDSIVQDRQFALDMLQQYDFKRTHFDNGQHGEYPAHIHVQRLERVRDHSEEVTASLQLNGLTFFQLPGHVVERIGSEVVEQGTSVSLFEVFERDPDIAHAVLNELKRQIEAQHRAASLAKRFMEDVQQEEDCGYSSLEMVRERIQQRRSNLEKLPGMKKIIEHIPDLEELLEEYYFLLLSE